MLANDDYRQSGLFDRERKKIVFSSIPQLIEIREKETEKEGKSVEFKGGANYDWQKITSDKVIIKKITCKNSIPVKIKEDKESGEYVAQEGVGKILNGLYFYSFASSDSVEYAPIVREKIKEVIKSKIPLPDYYRSFSGITESYWKDLEPKGTKCLILRIEEGNFIRNANKNGEELNAEAVNKEFLILDGIDYKSNNADHTLIYMVI